MYGTGGEKVGYIERVMIDMDLGIADDGERAGDEQAAQIAITLLVISCISRRENHWQSRLLRNHRRSDLVGALAFLACPWRGASSDLLWCHARGRDAVPRLLLTEKVSKHHWMKAYQQ